ncbi:MAG: hypothetical protein IH613_13315 [Desulfuromonadales bacterium]|nr:hypothetical protein [Desulfuromonadales bacterium]
MDLSDAFSALAGFSGKDLTVTLSRIEQSLVGKTADNCTSFLSEHKADHDVLGAVGLVKQLAGQINVVIHALGIMLCLPHILQPGEVVESSSLGAGNTGKSFDLETNLRVAEFKFIAWQGGPESIRQNSLFKDFYGLAEYDTSKSRYMYVLGTEIPTKFLRSKRSLKSVLSKDVSLYEIVRQKYPDCRVVSDYYSLKSDAVFIEDVSMMVPELIR